MRHAASPDLSPSIASRDARPTVDVSSALRNLEQAARGEHAAWCLSSAFDSVLRHAERGNVAPDDQAALKELLSLAEKTAMRVLPHPFPLASLRAGISALAGIIDRWNAPRADGRNAFGHMADLRAVARILQNEFHNQSLREEIADRSRQLDRSCRNGNGGGRLH